MTESVPTGEDCSRISVVVPTYGRPDQLMRCLDGLDAQTLPPIQVLVVVRTDDHRTKDALASRKEGVTDVVEIEGAFVAALNAGLAAASGDVVAFTDDDAVPKPDWLARIRSHLLHDPSLGGVGGRDLWPDDPGPTASTIGCVSWYGRLVGNHHLGSGPPRQVDVLKGVNMAFRTTAVADLRFDDRLLGTNMQIHSEIGFCLALQRRGWKLLYDPAVLVDHNLAARSYQQRTSGAPAKVFMEAHNELLGVATGLTSMRRLAAVAYAFIVGSRSYPGPVLGLERLIVGHEGWTAMARMRAATSGRLRALSTIRATRESQLQVSSEAQSGLHQPP